MTVFELLSLSSFSYIGKVYTISYIGVSLQMTKTRDHLIV